MIIFGSKTKPKVVGAIKGKCRECKKSTMHGIIDVREWFTLYFLPVIPLNRKVFTRCMRCLAAVEIEGDAKKTMIKKAG